jgi:molybdopterin-guanine dinucleotide biosynthesis protein A
MNSKVDFPCVVLAGGKSRRFGSPKGLVDYNKRPLISHVISNMTEQTQAPVRINTSPASPYAKFGETIIEPPEYQDLGPVVGILSSLIWARQAGYDRVATVPLDTPLLPSSLLSKLKTCAAPTFAATPDRLHYIIGLWPVVLINELRKFLNDGRRSAKDWVEACTATPCLFEVSADDLSFINVNTPEDLASLQRIHRER